ncbi:MAG TPA: M48 family metalloprotease [Gammaproteobacteria bacterium]|nr:M48 family metalloprotease [Gammaproteobacteria bacterium]
MKTSTLICAAGLAAWSILASAPLGALSLNFGEIKDTLSKVKQATSDVPVEEEIETGGMVMTNLLGAAPLVPDEEAQRYVNRVGMWVAQQTERAGLPWRFGIIASDNVNAFAAPGGYVVITRGLFMMLNNEAELAGVLGHEIGHVVARHHLLAMKKDARMGLLGDVVGKAAENKGRDKKKVAAIMDAGTQLYARGLDREDEFAADRMGVVYAARAGYDPYALLDVLTTLDSLKDDEPTIALLTKTHPPFKDRLQLLDLAIEGRLDAFAAQPVLQDRLLAMQLRLQPTQQQQADTKKK